MADCQDCETQHRRTLVVSLALGVVAGALITFLVVRRGL